MASIANSGVSYTSPQYTLVKDTNTNSKIATYKYYKQVIQTK